MNEESRMRVVFEDWQSNGGRFPRAVSRKWDGAYKLMQTAEAWAVWKTAWCFGKEDLRNLQAAAAENSAQQNDPESAAILEAQQSARCPCGYPMPCALKVPVGFCRVQAAPIDKDEA